MMHGLEKEQFKRFEKVMSGHFHKKSDDGLNLLSRHTISNNVVRS